ncbi:DUF2934 domain-containing protein [Magnetospira sp. QH-2]|uniref:DUF2934 domain-containing protein n=1 Tax=Magnetospira sp. (strain QH-2) TaxID=1288970 RepID=UPI0003E80FE8|nr:DUF2934 domain-containing protein [Magnetospira sp. QH-2]CCQ72438.1 protein of unknown function [Magnetospira sp. QH-2]
MSVNMESCQIVCGSMAQAGMNALEGRDLCTARSIFDRINLCINQGNCSESFSCLIGSSKLGSAIFEFKMNAKPAGLKGGLSEQPLPHQPTRKPMNIWRIQMSKTNEESIRDRAYQIWEKEGHPTGNEDANWTQAELELSESPKVLKVQPVKRPSPQEPTLNS